MKKYVKEFLHRGMMFAGFGPIILGIVYVCISASVESFTLTAVEVCIAIVSIYLLAFLQAGASVFNEIEHWGLAKSMLCHFITIYVAYVGCYLVNYWIPFEPIAVVIFTAIFVTAYFIIWFIVYFSIKATSKKLNRKLI